ncbi:MAG: MFS transporter [Mycobacteriales bacterium]
MSIGSPAHVRTQDLVGSQYKWVVLSNTTIGVVLASMNATSLIIALPVIFRGIHLNPLDPSNFPYLLWIMMGYMLVTAALVVTAGRIADMFGRVRMYNLGFAWFTVGSILLSLVWSRGSAGALELIFMRMFQAIGGTMLMANSAAIITDAFPTEQLGLALGVNMVAAIFGSFFGILAGGLLSQVGWRWVFIINVPVGVFGTVWAYLKLKEIGIHARAKIDWLGNVTFAGGLAMLLIGFTYGIKPYGHSLTGWGDPFVIEMIFGGLALLALFIFVEMKVAQPMFRLSLFRVRAFTAGNVAQFLGAVGRGGLQFMLIIWFQGIWLPQHGYAFTDTPLWSGIYMLPWMGGFVLAGPISGRLSDRYGARLFTTGGMVLSAAMYLAIMAFPPNFAYGPFAVVMLVSGISMGLFAAPNTASIMNSVPARERGVASGMRVTFGNAGMPLSMGLFFTLMVFGLNAKVPAAMLHGLVTHGVPVTIAARLAHLPPLGYLFASFLGYNPLAKLLGPRVLAHLPPHQAARLTSRSFFPQLIGAPFKHGLVLILSFALVMCLIAAVASALRGKRFVHEEAGSTIDHGRRFARAGGADGLTTLPRSEVTAAAGFVPAFQGERVGEQPPGWVAAPARDSERNGPARGLEASGKASTDGDPHESAGTSSLLGTANAPTQEPEPQ